ncbi:MAG: hypothetical protein GX847_02220 [Clostridiales bacterium]|nr:hypothetical protein [Clostridiales bacterium]
MSYGTGSFPVTADGTVVGSVTITQNGLMLVFDCSCAYSTRDILRLAAVCRGKYIPLGVMMPQSGRPEEGNLHTKKSFTKNALLSAGYEDTELFYLIRPDDVYSEPEADEPEPEIQVEDAPDVEPEEPPCDLPAQDNAPIVYNDFPDPADYSYNYSNAAEPAPPEEPEDTAYETADGWTRMPNPGILFSDMGIQESCQDVSNALISEGDGYLQLAVPVIPTEPFPLMPVFCFGSSGQAGGQDCIIFKIKNGNLIL